jgi:hypothetical protein
MLRIITNVFLEFLDFHMSKNRKKDLINVLEKSGFRNSLKDCKTILNTPYCDELISEFYKILGRNEPNPSLIAEAFDIGHGAKEWNQLLVDFVTDCISKEESSEADITFLLEKIKQSPEFGVLADEITVEKRVSDEESEDTSGEESEDRSDKASEDRSGEESEDRSDKASEDRSGEESEDRSDKESEVSSGEESELPDETVDDPVAALHLLFCKKKLRSLPFSVPITESPIVLTLVFIRKNAALLGIVDDDDDDVESKLYRLKYEEIKGFAEGIEKYLKTGSVKKLATKLKLIQPVKLPDPKIAAWISKSKKLMEADYMDNWDLLDSFGSHIRSCVSNHKATSDYFAPYCTIVQSSGNGKSKLILEYGKKREAVIYGSLGSEKATCYPQGHPTLIKLFKQSSSLQSMVHVICFIYISALRCLKKTFLKSKNKSDALKTFMDKQQIYEEKSDSRSFLGVEYKRKAIWTVNMLHKELSDPVILQNFKVILLALDEARSLLIETNDGDLNQFRWLRRGLAEVASQLSDKKITKSPGSEIFLVLCDTTSKVTNFSPALYLDPSGRANGKNLKLHPPFTAVNNMDAYFIDKKTSTPGWTISEDEFFHYKNFFRIGRPLLSLYILHPDQEDASVNEAVSFAMSKLLCGPPQYYDNHSPTSEVYLALLNVRVPLSFGRTGSLSESLASSHMRIIKSVSKSREVIFGGYSNEPVLSHAAQRLSCNKIFSPNQILTHFKTSIISGLTDVGKIGEQMLAYMYILARDQLFKEGQRTNHLFKVSELLHEINPKCADVFKSCLNYSVEEEIAHIYRVGPKINKRNLSEKKKKNQAGSSTSRSQGESLQEARVVAEDQEQTASDEDITISWITEKQVVVAESLTKNKDARTLNLNKLLNGDMTFSHFLDIENTPTMGQLEEAFYRGYAFMSYPNQAGVDIYIPVRIQGSIEPCQIDYEDIASRSVFPFADKIFKCDQPSPKKVSEDRLEKLKAAYQFKMSSIVDTAGKNYVYTALCIQSKNAVSSSPMDDVYIDLASSGVPNSSKIPCLAMKHVLRTSTNLIEPMPFQGKPYRYGIVIEGLQLFRQAEEHNALRTLINEVLEIQANALSHVEENDIKIIAQGFNSHTAELSENCIDELLVVDDDTKRSRNS